MALEERTLETIGDRCEVCGAAPDDATELEAILGEPADPVLCQVHARRARCPLAERATSRPSAGYQSSSTILPSLPPAAKRS